MINVNELDRDGLSLSDESALLERDPESVRTFYSLTGSARKEYITQVAEAEAQRIRTVRQAQADGIREIRAAEAAC